MKKQNTYQSSFRHDDHQYELWYDGRYDALENEDINIDTVKARQIFAQSVIDFLNNNFNLSLQYDCLYMPKFYNYENDKINFSYNDNDFELLLSAIKDYELTDELEQRVQQVTSSCSGYIAFYNEYELKADKDLYISVILETLFNSGDVQDEYEQYYDYNCIYERLEDSVIWEGE